VKPDIPLQREIWEYVRKCVRLYRSARALPPELNGWDDMAQEIFIHVLKRWKLVKKGRAWQPWVRTVTQNQLKNKIRDRMTQFRRMPSIALVSKMVQPNQWDEEILVYEQDIAAPEDGVQKTRDAISELPERERLVVDTFVSEGQWSHLPRKLKMTTREVFVFRQRAAHQIREML